jgi:hypothetical protein
MLGVVRNKATPSKPNPAHVNAGSRPQWRLSQTTVLANLLTEQLQWNLILIYFLSCGRNGNNRMQVSPSRASWMFFAPTTSSERDLTYRVAGDDRSNAALNLRSSGGIWSTGSCGAVGSIYYKRFGTSLRWVFRALVLLLLLWNFKRH